MVIDLANFPNDTVADIFDPALMAQHRELVSYQEHLGDFISLQGIDIKKPLTSEELIKAVLLKGTARVKNFVFALDIFTHTPLVL